jgi:hypothetical protein
MKYIKGCLIWKRAVRDIPGGIITELKFERCVGI